MNEQHNNGAAPDEETLRHLEANDDGYSIVPLTETIDPKSPNYGLLDTGDGQIELAGLPHWAIDLIVRGRDAPGEGETTPQDAIRNLVRVLVADNRMTADEIEVLLTDCPMLGICRMVVGLQDGAQIVRSTIESMRCETKPGPVLSRQRWSRNAYRFTNDFGPTLRHHQDEYFVYRDGAYRAIEDATVESAAWKFMVPARVVKQDKDGKWTEDAFNPTSKDVSELTAAVRRNRHVARGEQEPPFWLPGHKGDAPPPRECISLRNGILHVPTLTLLPPTADFFTLNALEFEYDAQAQCPLWEKTVSQYWPPKPDGSPADEVLLLQEIFGNLVLPDTSMQKIFLLLGPPRSGKGTIARVLVKLLGQLNYASPSLASLSGEFGLMNVIGKLLMLVTETQFGKRADPVDVANILKSISGEDPLSINRKNKSFWTGTLLARILMLANKMPAILDDSPALAARMVILRMTESFLGKEDETLTDSLTVELPGILNWSLRGYDRLREKRRFTVPESGRDAAEQFTRLASPARAFVEDTCDVGGDGFVEEKVLHGAYRSWCESNNARPLNLGDFIQAVVAAFPGTVKQHRLAAQHDARRPRGLKGIRLRIHGGVNAEIPFGT